MELGIKGKVAIVTGGARGIGAGVCEAFAKEGCNVVINYFSSSKHADALANELESKYGIIAFPVQADIGKEEDIVRMYKEVLDKFGTVDFIINNAAATSGNHRMDCPIEEFSVEDYHHLAAVSLDGVMVMCREFTKIVKGQNKKGAIVNVLSKTAFWTGSVNNSQYASVKGADAVITKNLAHELAPYGIRVNAVIPGYIENSTVDKQGPRYLNMKEKMPMKRWGLPEEIANVMVFLCSDKAILINGDFIDTTGGCMNGDLKPNSNIGANRSDRSDDLEDKK